MEERIKNLLKLYEIEYYSPNEFQPIVDEDDETKVAFVHNTVKLGNNVSLGNNVLILPNTEIKDDVYIGEETFIGSKCYIQNEVEICRNCYIGHHNSIYHRTYIDVGTEIGSFNTIFHMTQIINNNTEDPDNESTIIIGDYNEIGTGVTIRDGVRIGSHCLIGSNSKLDEYVVLKDHVILEPKCIINKSAYLDEYVKLQEYVIIGEASTVYHHSEIKAFICIPECMTVPPNTNITLTNIPIAVPIRSFERTFVLNGFWYKDLSPVSPYLMDDKSLYYNFESKAVPAFKEWFAFYRKQFERKTDDDE